MAQKAFITGISGFAGSYLASSLLKHSYQVSGTYLFDKSLESLSKIKESLSLHKVDLTQKEGIEEAIEKEKPELVFHLAALTSPAQSFSDPEKTITNNVVGQIHLFEAIRKSNSKPRILIVSSAEIYGIVDEKKLPIDEETPFVPASPYAVSKITQDFLGLQYGISYDMDIVRVRPFNHIGPGQSPHFVVSAFAKKIAEIEKNGEETVIKVGDLKPKRDFTDVRDVVEAYRFLLEKGKKGDVYNLGSGKSYSISEILEKLLALSTKKITAEEDPLLLRPSDNPHLLCDITKIQNAINWSPAIPLDQTLKDTLDYWRAMV